MTKGTKHVPPLQHQSYTLLSNKVSGLETARNLPDSRMPRSLSENRKFITKFEKKNNHKVRQICLCTTTQVVST